MNASRTDLALPTASQRCNEAILETILEWKKINGLVTIKSRRGLPSATALNNVRNMEVLYRIIILGVHHPFLLFDLLLPLLHLLVHTIEKLEILQWLNGALSSSITLQ